MKRRFKISGLIIILFVAAQQVQAQCAMCTKTAAQLGEKPAEGLNAGIIYLMAVPFLIMIFLGYKMWKSRG